MGRKSSKNLQLFFSFHYTLILCLPLKVIYHSAVSEQLTEFRIISLVEEKLVADALDNDVPGVAGPTAAHQCGEDGVSGEHVPLGFGQLQVQANQISQRQVDIKESIPSVVIFGSYHYKKATNKCGFFWVFFWGGGGGRGKRLR